MSDFSILQLFAEIAVALIGFSAILIALKNPNREFSPADLFRIRLMLFSGFGTALSALTTLIVFKSVSLSEYSWRIVGYILCFYSIIGLYIFPKRGIRLRKTYPNLFTLKIVVFQTGTLIGVFYFSMCISLRWTEQPESLYYFALLLLLINSTTAFIRTLFYRAEKTTKNTY